MSKNFLVIKNFEVLLVFFSDYDSYKIIKEFFYNNFSYFVKNYKFSERYRQGLWDGRKKLYKVKYDKGILKVYTSIGFLDDILSFFKSSNLIEKFSILDCSLEKYTQKDLILPIWFGKQLRYYQEQAVESLIKKRYGIISLPTGSGKMLVGVFLFFLLREKGVIVLRNIESIFQTQKEFNENLSGLKIGLFYKDSKDIENADVVLTTFSSFYYSIIQKNELFYFLTNKCNVLLIDEAHHISDNTYKEAISFYSPYRIYGMTGTAYRSDNADLEIKAVFGNLSYKADITDLQEKDFLSKSTICFIEISNFKFDKDNFYKDNTNVYLGKNINISSVDAKLAYRLGVVYNLEKVSIIKSLLEFFKGKKILILVKYKYHGLYYSRVLGYDFVYGGTDKNLRKDLLDRFINDSNYNVLIASMIYDESVNIPSLEVVINSSGYSSPVVQIQRHGRGIRKVEGKEFFIFIDFYDSFEKRAIKHSRFRISSMRREGLSVNICQSIEDLHTIFDNINSEK